MTTENTREKPVTEKIGEMRKAGLPFDLATALFVDLDKVAGLLTIRAVTGHIDEDHINEVDKLALLTVAYYRPDLLGHDDGGEEE